MKTRCPLCFRNVSAFLLLLLALTANDFAQCNYSWATQTSGTTALIYSVKTVSASVGWAAGAGAVIRRTTDGGVTWGNGNPNPGVITGDVYNIEAIDANTAWCTTSPGATFIYKTTNGGTNWVQVYTVAGGFINAIKMSTPLTGIATGDPLAGVWLILGTTNGGSTWVTLSAPPGTGDGRNNALQIMPPNNAWFGTGQGTVWRSTNAGVNWSSTVTTGLPGQVLGVHYNTLTEGLAGALTMVKSTDGGASYVLLPASGTGNITGIQGSGSDYWYTRGMEIYRSTNSGTTWTLAHTQTAVQNDISLVTDVNGCMVGWSGGATGTISKMTGTSTATSSPDYLYYKFENNPSALTVLNCAIPGVGTPVGVLGAGTPLNSGGQFDSCISGTQLTTGGITTGWNCNLGTSSWTISMWLTIPTDPSGSALYLFGDAGSAAFRCFHNGLALPDNLMLRGGFTDITVTGIGPAPTVVTFVYDSAAAQVRAYKNGVLSVTSSQTLNIITGTGFKVGGYGASTSFGGKMDEFRLWRRALTPAEVLAFSTQNLSGCGITGISGNNNEIPNKYSLSQNYPNPFNPTTNITFALPVAGNVELKIYDILGREVATVINTFVTAGTHMVPYNASALASGVYVYKITSGSFTDSKKMVLIK